MIFNPQDYVRAFGYLHGVEKDRVDEFLTDRDMEAVYSDWYKVAVNDPPNVYRVTTLSPTGEGSILDALEYNGEEDRHVIFDVAGTITLPERWAYKSKNIIVHGNTSPGGICLTGGTMAFMDCSGLTFRHLMWCLDEAPTERQARSWNPVKVLSDEETCTNIEFDHCTILGGDDENDFGPLNHQNVKVPVSMDGIRVSNCIFGLGTRRWRGNHNFSLAVSYAKNVEIDGNVFAHNNRRNPQVYSPHGEQYEGGVISNNIIYNYGSMGIGVIWGTWDIVNNRFRHGRNSKPRANFKPIKTTSSFEDESDYSSLYLQDNVAYKRWGAFLGRDWDIYGHEDNSRLIRRTGPDNIPRRDHAEVARNAGTKFNHAIEQRVVGNYESGLGTWIMTMADIGGVPQLPENRETFDLPKDLSDLYEV
jgi:hypothetical protein